MKYRVIWSPIAEQGLAEIWLRADDRGVISMVANELDTRLQMDPETQGESRENSRRILLVPPLGIKFRVIKSDLTVQVIGVWRFDTQTRG